MSASASLGERDARECFRGRFSLSSQSVHDSMQAPGRTAREGPSDKYISEPIKRNTCLFF